SIARIAFSLAAPYEVAAVRSRVHGDRYHRPIARSRQVWLNRNCASLQRSTECCERSSRAELTGVVHGTRAKDCDRYRSIARHWRRRRPGVSGAWLQRRRNLAERDEIERAHRFSTPGSG